MFILFIFAYEIHTKQKVIKANELRIGNWVNYDEDGTNFIVTEISETGIAVVNDEELTWIELDQFSGIPLTSGWLVLKFGFKDLNEFINTPNTFRKGDFEIIKCFWDEGQPTFHLSKTPNGDLTYYRHGKVPIIQYVHQLQNLYFALTGEELKQ